MDTTRERLIGRHNRITTNQSGLCRTLLGFAIMIAITVSLLITGLVLTGQGMLYQPKYHEFHNKNEIIFKGSTDPSHFINSD